MKALSISSKKILSVAGIFPIIIFLSWFSYKNYFFKGQTNGSNINSFLPSKEKLDSVISVLLKDSNSLSYQVVTDILQINETEDSIKETNHE